MQKNEFIKKFALMLIYKKVKCIDNYVLEFKYDFYFLQHPLNKKVKWTLLYKRLSDVGTERKREREREKEVERKSKIE